ncbi:hypothetical protein VD0002_g935 [Verticillium dahliae]|uniref:DUF7702 domain-containing protein n=2 Tax=Verticillium dahliae TaxID=27337 RepID=G2X0P8_VERDV|nr:uncharacterized protein VDAG_03827 [Verticillium dahliae VdLs.17]KAF3343886.1 Putative small nuclear ribonucleoprotein G [Verticillium dahliae VDG2]KAH6704794.1 hypothetical protein EV126DRAFT_196761 [Verticillium dahliae]EGY22389.1 hypothetical protein VDAG_03827 [Verticillium dahliae VdLs.17]PNH33627.1 hypothetical protein BJF96_g3076 [Verticillium dahliae]PNH51441.1 hypothetical protein VD0003_g5810 [Verticillium dahliae]
MVHPQAAVGIAQVMFYAPMLPTAIFVLVKNWRQPPRMAGYPLVTFCLLRLAGGIISIIRGPQPRDIGLIIADSVLLNVGLIPLLVSLIGIMRITLNSSLDKNSRARQFLKAVRFTFLAAIVLQAVAGGISSDDSSLATARILTKAAYVILAAILALATAEMVYLLTQTHRISASGCYYIRFALVSVPFLAVRTAYGLLYAFTIHDPNTIWNPLVGSAAAFALTCLLVEYIVLMIFIYLGIHRIWHPSQPLQETEEASKVSTTAA